MKSIMFPEFPRLQGEEAIEALHNFIKELDGGGKGELTKKQNNALKKAAKGIIVSIETEKSGEPQNKGVGFASRLRKSIVGSDKLGRAFESRRLWSVAE